MKRTLAALLIVAFIEPALLACPVCFQADDSATSRGIQAAVIVLFAVTTAVLSVCGVFVARFASREREVIRRAVGPVLGELRAIGEIANGAPDLQVRGVAAHGESPDLKVQGSIVEWV